MMSPYAGLDSPISVQAWGHQLKLDSAGDKRIKQFADFLTLNNTFTPEPGASCENPDFIANPLVAGQASRRRRADRRTPPDAPAARRRRAAAPLTDRPTPDPTDRQPPPAAARCGRSCSRSSRSGWCCSAAGWPSCWASAATTRPGPARSTSASPATWRPTTCRAWRWRTWSPTTARTRPCAAWPSTSPRRRPTRSGACRAGSRCGATRPPAATPWPGWATTCATCTWPGGTALMPGMATEEELANLRSLSGTAFDVEFLRLMIRHHQGGLADGAVRRGARRDRRRAHAGEVDRGLADGRDQADDRHARRRGAAPRCRRPEARRRRDGPEADSVSPATRTSPRSSGDRALPSGGRGAGSNPAGGTHPFQLVSIPPSTGIVVPVT